MELNRLKKWNFELINLEGNRHVLNPRWHLKNKGLDYIFCDNEIFIDGRPHKIGAEDQEITCPRCIAKQARFLRVRKSVD